MSIVFASASHASNLGVAQILTLREAADLLRVSPAEVESMAIKNELPGRRIGKEWRFHRSAVTAWLAGKDPVKAALTAETLDDPAPLHGRADAWERLDIAQLDTIRGRGASEITNKSKSDAQKADTIGEKPDIKTAEQVFLRDQAVLLKSRQMTLELGLSYARNDQQTLVSQLTDFGLREVETEIEQDTFLSSYSVRYGLLDDLQLFAGIPLVYRNTTQKLGSREVANSESTYWGEVTAGLRYAALHEGLGYPSVILSVNGIVPTRDSPWGIGGSIALTKSLDPAVLFANIGFQHYFNDSVRALPRLQPEDQVNATAGIAYALNDTLTLSTSIAGVFSAQTRFSNGLVLPAQERYSLRFALTAFLTDGLFIEPSVSFGLNGNSSDVTFGLNLPYTFDI